jgi:hypothetical protein
MTFGFSPLAFKIGPNVCRNVCHIRRQHALGFYTFLCCSQLRIASSLRCMASAVPLNPPVTRTCPFPLPGGFQRNLRPGLTMSINNQTSDINIRPHTTLPIRFQRRKTGGPVSRKPAADGKARSSTCATKRVGHPCNAAYPLRGHVAFSIESPAQTRRVPQTQPRTL